MKTVFTDITLSIAPVNLNTKILVFALCSPGTIIDAIRKVEEIKAVFYRNTPALRYRSHAFA